MDAEISSQLRRSTAEHGSALGLGSRQQQQRDQGQRDRDDVDVRVLPAFEDDGGTPGPQRGEPGVLAEPAQPEQQDHRDEHGEAGRRGLDGDSRVVRGRDELHGEEVGLGHRRVHRRRQDPVQLRAASERAVRRVGGADVIRFHAVHVVPGPGA
jgi:hypothetical protein